MYKIRSFTDLNTWKEGHRLVLDVYRITKLFPPEERYCLIDQMRRCVVSITSNIAEGFSRKTKKEKAQFFYMALGSVSELQNQLLICRDLGYIKAEDFKKIANQTVVVSKLVNGLIKSSKAFNT
jgi:four helix bundle protein